MGDKSIKKEVKKKKKTDTKASVSLVAKPVVTQPELIRKKKKEF